jgi:hypothetical protein
VARIGDERKAPGPEADARLDQHEGESDRNRDAEGAADVWISRVVRVPMPAARPVTVVMIVIVIVIMVVPVTAVNGRFGLRGLHDR